MNARHSTQIARAAYIRLPCSRARRRCSRYVTSDAYSGYHSIDLLGIAYLVLWRRRRRRFPLMFFRQIMHKILSFNPCDPGGRRWVSLALSSRRRLINSHRLPKRRDSEGATLRVWTVGTLRAAHEFKGNLRIHRFTLFRSGTAAVFPAFLSRIRAVTADRE